MNYFINLSDDMVGLFIFLIFLLNFGVIYSLWKLRVISTQKSYLIAIFSNSITQTLFLHLVLQRIDWTVQESLFMFATLILLSSLFVFLGNGLNKGHFRSK